MAQDRNRRRFQPEAPTLERRELLARPPLVHAAALGVGVFDQRGVSSSVLHKAFVNHLNLRLSISASQAHLVFEAFQVFKQGYAAPPPAAGGRGPALDALLGQLDGHPPSSSRGSSPPRSSRRWSPSPGHRSNAWARRWPAARPTRPRR